MIVGISNDLWLREMEIKEEGEKRQNDKEMKAHLNGMVLRMKPEANRRLNLTTRIATLGMDAFDRGPAIITKIHAYLAKELNLAENAEEKSTKFKDRMWQITLEAFLTQSVRGEEGFEWTDSIVGRVGSRMYRVFPGKNLPGTL